MPMYVYAYGIHVHVRTHTCTCSSHSRLINKVGKNLDFKMRSLQLITFSPNTVAQWFDGFPDKGDIEGRMRIKDGRDQG